MGKAINDMEECIQAMLDAEDGKPQEIKIVKKIAVKGQE